MQRLIDLDAFPRNHLIIFNDLNIAYKILNRPAIRKLQIVIGPGVAGKTLEYISRRFVSVWFFQQHFHRRIGTAVGILNRDSLVPFPCQFEIFESPDNLNAAQIIIKHTLLPLLGGNLKSISRWRPDNQLPRLVILDFEINELYREGQHLYNAIFQFHRPLGCPLVDYHLARTNCVRAGKFILNLKPCLRADYAAREDNNAAKVNQEKPPPAKQPFEYRNCGD